MASSSSDQGATPLSYFKYDVFLSFRGYTRYDFTDTLYHALIKARIETFRDTEGLRIGEELEGSLVDAIERSRMSVLVLCDKYPTSKWCLDELDKIMECSENGKTRPVLPIYFHVLRSDVQYEKNSYRRAMIDQEKGRYKHRVEAWRSALSAVGSIYGQNISQLTPWNEAIIKIVKEVRKRVPPVPLYIDHPLGCDSELEEAKSLLQIDSCATCLMLGIHGDGEISQFVAELYNKIRPHFASASFLSNVSEKTNASGGGLEHLQVTLLSEMGKEVKSKMGSTFRGSSEIKYWLCQERVLLVLDDVDKIQQLNSLARREDWFGHGSRIIITTRHEGVLDEHRLSNGVEIKKYHFVVGQVEEDDVEEGDVVGFTKHWSFVKGQLYDAKINVISIIGMGGLGKTTVAQEIYKNKEVKNSFHTRGWTRVSKDYEPRGVLLKLIQSLMKSTSAYQNLEVEDLKKKVSNYLKGKKYLIVLDDIWKPEVWDDLKSAFPIGSTGSKILITSRDEQVANFTGSRSYKLPPLDEKESWELFCKKVFSGKECPSELEPHGRSIVESCGGLPLAIVAMAGVVAKKKRLESEWLGIKESIHWHLTRDMTKVMDVLQHSYDNLSEELKPCFRYLGIYPEDFEIPSRELIQLWMAEGFMLQESGLPNAPEPEVVGEEYLKELVDRNMVIVSRQRSDGGVKTCLIHDLFRDLCIILSKADKFFEVCTGSNIHTLGNPQRLSLLCSETSCMSSLETNQSSTRSLFMFAGKGYSDDVLKNFQSVQVLHLGNKACFLRIPSNFQAMIFLKYLKITRTREFRKAPECIWSLPNLETMDTRGWKTICIPKEFWKLKRLRHVYILANGVSLPTEENGEDSRIKTTMWNLQTLSGVDLDTPTALLFRDGRFPNLKRLTLCLEREKRPSWHELLLSLQHLSNLHMLKIHCCHSDLSIDAKMFPKKLAKITFKVFGKVDSSSMKALGQLHNLQVLKLEVGTISDPLDCAAGDFPKLQVFKMVNVKVESWLLAEGAMPRLRCLLIQECPKLHELPKQLWSLKTLAQVRVIEPSDELINSLQNVKVNHNCDLTISPFKKYLDFGVSLKTLALFRSLFLDCMIFGFWG